VPQLVALLGQRDLEVTAAVALGGIGPAAASAAAELQRHASMPAAAWAHWRAPATRRRRWPRWRAPRPPRNCTDSATSARRRLARPAGCIGSEEDERLQTAATILLS
jgi:hypothetical protein